MKSKQLTALQLKMAKSTYQIFIIISILLFFLGLKVEGIIITMFGICATIGLIYKIIQIGKFDKGIQDFKANEGFLFYRGGIKHPKYGFINIYTIIEVFLVVMLLLGFILKATIGAGISSRDSNSVFIVAIAIIVIEVYYKRIISFMNKDKILDYAIANDLRIKGIISVDETIKGLYKDFDKFENAEPGNKLVYITNEYFSYILFDENRTPKRLLIPANEIKKFGVLGFLEITQSAIVIPHKLVYIGASNGRNYRFNLSGRSKHLPKEFIPNLITLLDKQVGKTDISVEVEQNKVNTLQNIEELMILTEVKPGLGISTNYIDL